MTRIKCILIILLVNIAICTNEKCKYDKCRDSDNPRRYYKHTMCLYSNTSLGVNCRRTKSKFLRDDEKKEILKTHNKLRAKVAAGKELRGLDGKQPAGIIKPLKWSKELAMIAQRWANQCEIDHDKCRDVDGIEIGQNIGLRCNFRRSNLEFVRIVTDWYKEVENCTREIISKFARRREPPIAHYTQLVWADTTHVGCGGIKYVTRAGHRCVELVCNYGPHGNRYGEAVYKIRG